MAHLAALLPALGTVAGTAGGAAAAGGMGAGAAGAGAGLGAAGAAGAGGAGAGLMGMSPALTAQMGGVLGGALGQSAQQAIQGQQGPGMAPGPPPQMRSAYPGGPPAFDPSMLLTSSRKSGPDELMRLLAMSRGR